MQAIDVRIGARRATPQAGYSLIEVLAASALLLGVLLAIMGMFIYGGRSVQSGKLMTKATAIAEDILEEFRKFSYAQTYQVINDTADPNTTQVHTWNSRTSTFPPPSDAAYQAILNAWKQQAEKELPQGTGEIIITVRGLKDLGTGSGPTAEAWAKARILQIVVSVKWKEQRRQRSVVFESLKS